MSTRRCVTFLEYSNAGYERNVLVLVHSSSNLWSLNKESNVRRYRFEELRGVHDLNIVK